MFFKRFSYEHPLPYALISCALVIACLIFAGADSLQTRLLHEAAAAFFALLAFCLGDFGGFKSNAPAKGLLPCIGVSAIGLVAGIVAYSMSDASSSTPHVGALILHLVLCVLIALCEEALFRGVLFQSVRRCLEPRADGAFPKGSLLKAALICAFVFALLHLMGVTQSVSCLAGIQQNVALVQAIAKFVEGMLFALVMTALAIKTESLLMPVIAHALFDFFSESFSVLQTGAEQATYFTGALPDAVSLLVCVVLLIPLAVWACRTLTSGIKSHA